MTEATPSAARPGGTSEAAVVRVRWLVRSAFVIGVFACAVQLVEIPWRSALRGYDNTFNYLWLRSLMVDGDWDFANDLNEANTLAEQSLEHARALPPTAIGRVPNKYGIGWSLLSVPGYILADVVVRTGNGVGVWSLPRDGFNPVYQVALQLWHVALAWLALVLARRVLTTWIAEPWATVGVVTVWLGSPLLYYQTSNIAMTHNAAFFAITVAAFGLVRGVAQPTAWWPWILAGAGFGLAAITRYQTLVFGLLAVWALVERLRQFGWRGGWMVGAMVAGFVPFIALQCFAWHVVYGRWLVFSYGVEEERFNWLEPAFASNLFSPWHGLFYWHPLLFIAMAGLAWAAFARRGVMLAWFGSALATIYVNAAWWCWWFAGSFGNRAFDAALLALMAGQSWLFARANRLGRRILAVACGFLIVWNLYVFVLYRAAAISRSERVTWGEMLRAAARLPDQFRFE